MGFALLIALPVQPHKEETMLSTTEQLGVLPKLDNTLLLVQDQLAQVLAACIPGQECKWDGVLQAALGRAEESLRQRLTRAGAPERPRAGVGQAQATIDRQQEELSEHYHQLLDQCLALHAEVDRASAVDSGPSANGKARKGAGRTAWQGFHQRAEQFLADLRQTTEMETRLVQESLNVDLGAGD
jgi:hypothetical protein